MLTAAGLDGYQTFGKLNPHAVHMTELLCQPSNCANVAIREHNTGMIVERRQR
jgi:hypothetical protein